MLIGEIKAGDVWLPGSHAPIVSRELWDQAHALIASRHRPRKHRPRERQDFLLKGKVFGADGRAYSPWCSSLRNKPRLGLLRPTTRYDGTLHRCNRDPAQGGMQAHRRIDGLIVTAYPAR